MRGGCLLSWGVLAVMFCAASSAQTVKLINATAVAEFGPQGLASVENRASGGRIDLDRDAWSIAIDDKTLSSSDAQPKRDRAANGDLVYSYEISGYRVEVVYRLAANWEFVSKTIQVLHAPTSHFTVHRVVPWDLNVRTPVDSDFVPSTYVPQFGLNIEQSRKDLPTKNFGEFLRFSRNKGALLTAQNPYLEVKRDGQSVSIAYACEMEWRESWGPFASDTAVVAAYSLSGHREPREMVTEWYPVRERRAEDGMDDAEVSAFTDCVRAFLISPSQDPISVEVGWTLNDYQIDVGTPEGRAEYKRVIDTASQLGVRTLVYAPDNSLLADRKASTDTWSWEYVLWLNLGEKIRTGDWDPEKDKIPASITEMLDYARTKHVGLLAYVYPSIPFAHDASWIVKRGETQYANLASRAFQDYLIQKLIAFQKRTGIAGYSFDYTWLNLPGASSYAQWYGWRRVIETLRREKPSLVIDGRQSYQTYGPWSWLAGSYPHPTGNDEQPESFKPFPDLHFDRVSADRARFVNFWYRNYQFAPEEIIPGYATHQTERSREVPGSAGGPPSVEMMYTRFRPRDWDYLGFRYSFLSSIATGGWNNVVDMIPGRDPAEDRSFSARDKRWIRHWLNWTKANKQYLLHTRTIIGQPALGHVDGTAAIVGDRGFLFLFNPNYKSLSAEFCLDQTIGLTRGKEFLLREIYPQEGRMLGKPGSGVWQRGDTVRLPLDGTSATVYQIVPAEQSDRPLIFNASALHAAEQPAAEIEGSVLSIEHAAGEPGTTQEIGVLLPRAAKISSVTLNGAIQAFTQSGRYIATQAQFEGVRFAQAQEIAVKHDSDDSDTLTGTFIVPQRVLDQLAARKAEWPIPWTKDDYETTWLAPERLLLYLQMADPKDTPAISAKLDGKPLVFRPAYTSVRVHAPDFVGFYADVSSITPNAQHTLELQVPRALAGQLQGVFFDNVTPQLTVSIAH